MPKQEEPGPGWWTLKRLLTPSRARPPHLRPQPTQQHFPDRDLALAAQRAWKAANDTPNAVCCVTPWQPPRKKRGSKRKGGTRA
jgi:hypothetical protein